MDFALSDEQRIALDAWRRVIERDIAAVTARYRDSVIARDAAQALLKIAGRYGVGCGWVSAEDGGLGLDFLTSGLLYEELSRVSPDLAGLSFVTEGAALKLARTGSAELKAQYLPRLLAGDLIGCSAISEPGMGSSVREMRTRAVRDGRYFRITGEKMWTSNATIADIVILVARTAESEFTMFLLDRTQHGFQTKEIDKLGLNGWSLGQIVLDDVMVPEENVLGGLGGGLRETMKGFERSRCFISTLALGIAQAALDDAVRYAGERHAFGKPIAGHQLVQGLLAQMATDLDASRLLVYRALWMMAQGERCEREAAVAKSFTTEAALRIASNAIQVHGAFGISREFPVERHFRNARMLTIPDGTTQINQLVIGRKLTGVDAFT
ncbi:MAG: acyl-CoA dehydrogenase family protein [Variibacter sp.]|nr:acyl-CoA dehydrogenase family protein [Variibacter sp.]